MHSSVLLISSGGKEEIIIKASLLRKDATLRNRYMTIINRFSLEERPWDERNDKILSDFFLTTKTYEEIGSEIGVTKTRVWQLITAQIKRIMHPKWLVKYWDVNYEPDVIVFSPEYVAETRLELIERYGNSDNWPIKEMSLSNASRNALLRCQIFTMGDLIKRYSELRDLKGLGAKRLKEINEMMIAYQLK